MNKKGFANFIIIFVIILVAVGVGYFVLVKNPKPTTIIQSISKSDETADWKTYRNEQYGFEFKYPPNWILSDSRFNFSTHQGYKAIFLIDTFPPVAKEFTIDDLRKEYDRVNMGNPRATKASEALKDIVIGNEPGLEHGSIVSEQENPWAATFEFYNGKLLNKGFKFLISIPKIKSADINSTYEPYSLFTEDIKIFRKILLTLKFK